MIYRDLDLRTLIFPFGAWKTPMTEQSDDRSLHTSSKPGTTAKAFDDGTTENIANSKDAGSTVVP